MNINSIPNGNHNTSFMMLNMPSEKSMAKIVGDKLAKQAELIRPAIANAAEELNGIADVFVKPINGKGDIKRNGFEITVKPLKQETNNLFKKLMNYFDDSGLIISDDIHNSFASDFSTYFRLTAENLINDYKKYLKGIKLEKELGNQIIMPSYRTMEGYINKDVAKGFEDARFDIAQMAKDNKVAVEVSINYDGLIPIDSTFNIKVSPMKFGKPQKNVFAISKCNDIYSYRPEMKENLINKTQSLINDLRNDGRIK